MKYKYYCKMAAEVSKFFSLTMCVCVKIHFVANGVFYLSHILYVIISI